MQNRMANEGARDRKLDRIDGAKSSSEGAAQLQVTLTCGKDGGQLRSQAQFTCRWIGRSTVDESRLGSNLEDHLEMGFPWK